MIHRTLIYAAKDGDVAISVTVDDPRQGDRDWSCAYEIGWPDAPRRGYGYGIDGTQALLLALKAIGTDLYTSDYHRSGRLRWVEPGDGYGYPVPKNIRDLLVGNDAEYDG
ncbi:hypothetical protein [Bosea sp. CS1GBMeth4]|uniref:DUF6968 family protein n=1 Tax=Bosea sp. CS1GBMeth4 TaxID=1892849 RepID=UPI001FCE7CAF|nr:hypothetical protein [Bosea sp. CS1GBMeth4]